MKKSPVQAIIACGSNLNDPFAQLEKAKKTLSGSEKIKLLKASKYYSSKPFGYENQSDFLNGAFLIETTLAPKQLLEQLLKIEDIQGRERTVPNGPRTLDLDLIFYGDQVIDKPDLKVPHPRAHERRFVLEPAAEVAPDWVHPVMGKTVSELLAAVL